MARTAREILEHHNKAVFSKNYKEIMKDYTDDSILITLYGIFKGKDAIEDFFRNNLLVKMPNMKAIETPDNVLLVEGDTIMVRWTAESDLGRIENGVDTFVFADDKIWRQTACFNIIGK
ncbi:MAG: nuclear transport factor 2 family protein [Spirochaetes bacterium]|nr:nuclear transport factor 2 family protein [Spirochaetota bacterium]